MNIMQHKSALLAYFDGLGFERWSAIYGDAAVSGVRRTIRAGHNQMLALAEAWMCEGVRGQGSGVRGQARQGEQHNSDQTSNTQYPTSNIQHPISDPRSPIPDPLHVLDAGCGTGLFTLALARRGLRVTAIDLAPQMVAATARAAAAAGLAEQVECHTSDLEAMQGSFDAVVCLDVLIHYPAAGFSQLCQHLAGLSRGRLLFTYAPRTPLLAALHWLGGRFPQANRRTNIQLLAPQFVAQALARAGMQLRRSTTINSGFYHVTLVEAVPMNEVGV